MEDFGTEIEKRHSGVCIPFWGTINCHQQKFDIREFSVHGGPPPGGFFEIFEKRKTVFSKEVKKHISMLGL